MARAKKPRDPRPTDLLTTSDIAAQYGWSSERAESLFRAICRGGQQWVYFEGYRRHFIERQSLEAALRRGAGHLPPPPEVPRSSREEPRFGRARTTHVGGTAVERRDGYYPGTDQPHTDSDGVPLSPTGKRWEFNHLSSVGEVYFVRHMTGGPIRIGYSGVPEYFVDTMNLNSHDRGYRLLATIEGGRGAERDLHARFRHLRIHGAWFLPEPELLAHIEEIVGPAEGRPPSAAVRR
jgi:hypothetical protein